MATPTSTVVLLAGPSTHAVPHNTEAGISASMPIDLTTMDDICYILEQPAYLEEIIFTPPVDPTSRRSLLENEISDTLVWFFGLTKDLKRLERVVLPLEFLGGVQAMFERLRRLPKLRSLTLTTPTSYDYITSPLRAELDKAIQKGLESLNCLQELTLPTDMITGKLSEALDLAFDASVLSYDEASVRYYNIRKV